MSPVVGTIVVCWMLGAVLSHWAGIWLALGGTAIVLAAAAWSTVGRVIVGRGSHVRMSIAGVLAGLAMAAITVVVFEPAMHLAPSLRGDVSRLYGLLAQQPLLPAAFLLPIIVASEEIVWRGAVQTILGARAGRLAACGLGTLLYAAAHLPVGSVALVLTCLVAGFCWALVRLWTDSLPATIATHLVWDVVVLFLVQLAPPA
ncbi:MAG: lysostaphin resistance A-like protein [Vicinamibacterales bacterium]